MATLTTDDFGTDDDDSWVLKLVEVLDRAGIHDEEWCDGPADLPGEVQMLVNERDNLREALQAILGCFYERSYVGQACARSGWIPEKQLTLWRVMAHVTAHNGPSSVGAKNTPQGQR